MDKIMDNPNMWHIRDQIFDPLNHETVLICRQVCQFWNESLARMSFLKILQEFGNRRVEYTNKKVSTIVAGWKEAVKTFVAQASLEELQEVKVSLLRLARGNGKCCSSPVHEAAKIGAVKLMEFILRTSFDMNTKGGYYGMIVWHLACAFGKTEIAQLIIQSSTEFGIDLNAKDNIERTSFHAACNNGQTETAEIIIKSSKDFGIDLNAKDDFYGSTALHLASLHSNKETVQMVLKNWKEFGIDIRAQDNYGKTPLTTIDDCQGRIWNQIKKILEEEYSQIDVT